MTTANKITIFRILLVPFFIVEVLSYVGDGEELHRFLAIAAFLLASVCDGVDGYIARRYNQRSELGAILDPLADKMLLVAGIVLLSLHHEQYLPHLPLWLTATVISRDVLLLTVAIVIILIAGYRAFPPSILGKFTTAFQIILVFAIVLAEAYPNLQLASANRILIYTVAALTTLSGFHYSFSIARKLSS